MEHIKTKKKKKNPVLKNILFLSLSMGVGLLLGVFGAVFLPETVLEWNVFHFVLGIIFFCLSYFLHILIHELGHLIFGLLTGYSFVSFRVGSFTIIKEDGKFKRKKFHLPGTGGQCLMSPPEYSEKSFPYVIYNLGGVLLNLVASIIALGIILGIEQLSDFALVGWQLFLIAGLFTAVTNGIPLKIGGFPNDGHNIYSLMKKEENKKAFFIQLKMNALMTQGIRIKDIPFEELSVDELNTQTSTLQAAVHILQYNWYLDRLNLEKAQLKLTELLSYMDNYPLFYKQELACEQLFLALVSHEDSAVIEELYNEELKTYIKKMTFLPNKKRLLMALEAHYYQNEEVMQQYFKELLKTAETYPVRGEAEMEIMLGNWVKDSKTDDEKHRGH
ncbi:MAG: site-2 protease family protein [Desemzia incerta]|uniref:site-2 protease family protein n=1 Tax=Desemzia incerta TaxID=82801 RepID=UPI0033158B95